MSEPERKPMDPEQAFTPPPSEESEEAELGEKNYGDPQLEEPRFDTKGTVHTGVDPYTVPKEGEEVDEPEDTSNAENRIESPEELKEGEDNVVDWRERYYQSQMEQQQKEVENLKKMVEDLKTQGPKPETSEPEPLNGRDIDDVVTDPQLFEEVVNERVQAVLTPVLSRIDQLEQGVQSVPGEVQERMRMTQSLEKQVEDWYSRNKDLDFRHAQDRAGQQKRKIMMSLADEMHSQNPNSPIQDILDRVGDETRELFGVSRPRPGRTSDPKSSLASGRGSSRSSGGTTTKAEPREIDQILQGIL